MNLRRMLVPVCLLLSLALRAQNEPFTRRTVIAGLNSPWEITYGPNDSLWVTENFSYLVKRISVATGNATTLLNLSTLRNFALNDGGRWPQGGLMGLALHPNLYSADPSVRAAKPWVYLAYVYDRPTGQGCSTNANSSSPCTFHTRIVRYEYTGNALSNPVILIDHMPGSNDHNSGRLKIGPDLKLYYTIGDLGAGQFNNASRTNHAQDLDVLEGKVLRLNTESDGDAGADAWVPDDNPFYDGAPISPRDYVFTLGHRNAQGLVWASINGTNLLYSSEHGDKSDDEINLLAAGGNYGWNEVSGYCDGNYNGLTLGGNTGVNETAFCASTPANRGPLKTFFTLNQAGINALSADNLTWPTVAPSSIDFYGSNKIPGWNNSLLISCLKAGRVYRVKLDASGNALSPLTNGLDTTSYFHGDGRFRDLALSPDGLKIYVACDASGQTSGPSGGFNGGGVPPPNAGSILEYTYVGAVLALKEPHLQPRPEVPQLIRLSPNPAHDWLSINITAEVQRPFRLVVYNGSGLPVRELRTARTQAQLSLAGLASGLYYVQLYNGVERLIQTEKLVVR